MNYAELIRCLRDCWDASTGPTCDCDHCLFRDKIVDDVGYTDYTKCETAMVLTAADAIEKLLAERDEVNADSWKTAFEVERDEHRWIPVMERLPEEDGMYLVHGTWSASGRKVTDTCEFYVHDGYFRAAWNFDVTHWMPLPQPPKNEFYESLKTGLEQAINGETRSYTLVQALEDAGAEVKPGTGKMFCNGKEVDPEEVFESCFPPPPEDQP